MEEQEDQSNIATCLICKHALVSKLNIFKTRTNFSKTLVSSKLSKLLQAAFRQDAMPDAQDICTSCSDLINQVDECEIKLMALENEVKLKYKMPFPIEVHSRRTEPQQPPPQQQTPPAEQDPLAEKITAEQTVAPRGGQQENHGAAEAAAEQEFSFISIDGDTLEVDNPTIVLEAGQVNVDGNNVVVYREPYGDQPFNYDSTVPYLAQLEAAELHHSDDATEDVTQTDHSGLADPAAQRRRRPYKKRHSSKEAGDALMLCDLCDETFSSVDAFRRHKVSHANNKSFPCRFCTRVFTNKIALHCHWNETHPMKLQPCPYCDKRFIDKSKLNQHINTHQEPRFSCEMPGCTRTFHTRGDLRKHMIFRHSDKKSFPCPDCNLSFKVNWLLTRHRVRVHPTT